MGDYKCQYDGCDEQFEKQEDRLAHSMEEHYGIDPHKYPTLTGRRRFELE